MNNTRDLEAENARLREMLKVARVYVAVEEKNDWTGFLDEIDAALSPPSASEPTRDLEAENARLLKAIRDVLWECPQIAVVGVNFQEREHSRTKAIECIDNAVRAALSPPSASEQSAPPRDLKAENAQLREAVRKCESRAWEIAGLDGAEMDAAYNQGWTDGAERCAHAAAAIARAALASDRRYPPGVPIHERAPFDPSSDSAPIAGSPDAWRG